MKQYLMICGGEYDASDPDMEGPFHTSEERKARAQELWDNDVQNTLILILVDVDPQGNLSTRTYDPAREM